MMINNDKIPKVSVISIALDSDEFDPLIRALNKQTYKDFEFIGEAGGTIPEAWNRAIARAQGEILVFTETDARPVNIYWLEELVKSIPDKKTIVKGLEITHTPLDLSNMAAYRSVFLNMRFDESFRWAEDVELFCRLQEEGYQFLQVNKAPVIHLQKLGRKRMIRRAFRYGLYQARLSHRFENPVEIGSISNQVRILMMAGLKLAGLTLGYLFFWWEKFRRPKENTEVD